MKHWALFYDFVPDFMEKRVPLRPAHLELMRQYSARGELVLAGVLKGEASSLLVFKAEDAALIEGFVRQDSFFTGGLVTSYRVREWVTVVGEGALNQP
jgi:hypothetical protein